jgi:hypothetical protein
MYWKVEQRSVVQYSVKDTMRCVLSSKPEQMQRQRQRQLQSNASDGAAWIVVYNKQSLSN